MQHDNNEIDVLGADIPVSSSRIISLLLLGYKEKEVGNFVKIEAILERMANVINLLTPAQKSSILTKNERCSFYRQAKQNAIPIEKIKRMMCRKFSIDRRRIGDICAICENE
jgi:hypothetical protein